MTILVINCGSSSLKYQLIDMADESVLAKGLVERIGIDGHIKSQTADGRKVEYDKAFPDHTAAFMEVKENLVAGETKVVENLSDITAIGHRIVQGGALFNESVLVDESVVEGVKSISDLAPLHNPAHIQGYEAAKEVFGADVPQVFVFDNAFHSTMPPKAYTFPIPYEYTEKYSIRRYGFHGTSHRFVSKRLAELHPEYNKVIVCHLGNGSSLSAIKDGKVIDTSMGLTPLDGFIMGSRCGAVDPSAITYIMKKEGFTPDEMDTVMNKKSGFLGVSGVSSDMRDVEAAAAAGNERAQLAIDLLTYQVAKIIGSYAVALGGVDAICFTAGIGENGPSTRKAIIDQLGFMGIKIDDARNDGVRGKETLLSTDDSTAAVYLLPTNEELMIARDTRDIVEAL